MSFYTDFVIHNISSIFMDMQKKVNLFHTDGIKSFK